MDFEKKQIEELKKIAPNLSIAEEGGFTYILIEKLQLPDGCIPSVVDALLCPMLKDGYQSSLFYSTQPSGYPLRSFPNKQHNWNRINVRILDRSWFAQSWQVPTGLKLVEMLLIHLDSLR